MTLDLKPSMIDVVKQTTKSQLSAFYYFKSFGSFAFFGS